jgi:hypothetical protein
MAAVKGGDSGAIFAAEKEKLVGVTIMSLCHYVTLALCYYYVTVSLCHCVTLALCYYYVTMSLCF